MTYCFNGVIRNQLRTRRKRERRKRFLNIRRSWRNACDHERLRVSAERIRHEQCQLVVAVGNKTFAARERRDHVAERREREVDRLCLFQAVIGDTRFGNTYFKKRNW